MLLGNVAFSLIGLVIDLLVDAHCNHEQQQDFDYLGNNLEVDHGSPPTRHLPPSQSSVHRDSHALSNQQHASSRPRQRVT